MEQDVGMLWKYCGVIPILFGCCFFFEGSISAFTCFFLVTCSGCFFFVCLFSVCLLVLLGMWKKRWEGRLSGRCMVCKVWTYRTLLITKQQTVVINAFKITSNFSTKVETAALGYYACSVVWSLHIHVHTLLSTVCHNTVIIQAAYMYDMLFACHYDKPYICCSIEKSGLC